MAQKAYVLLEDYYDYSMDYPVQGSGGFVAVALTEENIKKRMNAEIEKLKAEANTNGYKEITVEENQDYYGSDMYKNIIEVHIKECDFREYVRVFYYVETDLES